MAIERYVTLKGHKDEARRAARVLETAVGEALGPAEQTYPGKNASLVGEALIAKNDRHRFRLMASHRDLWWPVLAETAVGEALGPVVQTYPGQNALPASKALPPRARAAPHTNCRYVATIYPPRPPRVGQPNFGSQAEVVRSRRPRARGQPRSDQVDRNQLETAIRS